MLLNAYSSLDTFSRHMKELKNIQQIVKFNNKKKKFSAEKNKQDKKFWVWCRFIKTEGRVKIITVMYFWNV